METRQSLQGQARLIREVIEKGICIKCGACVGLCPYFSYFDGQVVVLDRCNAETWRCLQICPRVDFDRNLLLENLGFSDNNGSPIGKAIEIFAARSTRPEIRQKGQYGGVVSSLVLHLLEQGLIQAAIMTDSGNSFSPGGRICTSEGDVMDCSGSRYSSSATLSALNQAIKEARKPLGVVGLPCQMEALARMVTMEPDGREMTEGIFIRIGLFCTWAIDYRELKKYLELKGIFNPPKRYDIPPPPAEVFVVETDSETTQFPLSEIRALVQKGCSLCMDMTAEFADISVGTLEGEQDWNTVIVRTEQGARVIDSALKNGVLEKMEIPAENLEHLKEAAFNKKRRATDVQKEVK